MPSYKMMEHQKEKMIYDQLQGMRHQEAKFYSYEGHLAPGSCGNFFNALWREKICRWSYNVADHFEFSREVVAVSLNIFDRYLATLGNMCPGNEALLISLASIQIAIKLYASNRVRSRTLASLSRGQFVPSDIEKMEWKIMEALKFRLNAPTAHSFVDYYVRLLPWEYDASSTRKQVADIAKYMTELAVCDPYFVSFPNSVVALAAFLNVLDQVSHSKLPVASRTKFLSDLCLLARINPYADQVAKSRTQLRRMVDLSGTKETDTMSSDRSTTSSLGSACRFVARSTRTLMNPMMFAGIQ